MPLVVEVPQENTQEFRATQVVAPRIAPFQDLGAQERERSAQALTNAGRAVSSTQEAFQKDADEAAIKAADLQYLNGLSSLMKDPNTGYLNTSGVQAKERFVEVQKSATKLREDVLNGLTDDQKLLYAPMVAQHELRANETFRGHVTQEMRNYNLKETVARGARYTQLAIGAQTDKERELNIGIAKSEVNNLADLNGWAPDSEQRKALLLEVDEQVVVGRLKDLIDGEDFSAARDVMADAVRAGRLSPSKAQAMAKVLKAGSDRQNTEDMVNHLWDGGAVPGATGEPQTGDIHQGFDVDGLEGWAKGLGVVVSSATRTEAHNRKVGGVPDSHHLNGTARDLIPPPGMTLSQLEKLVQKRYPGQYVLNHRNHIHIQWGLRPSEAAKAERKKVVDVVKEMFGFKPGGKAAAATPIVEVTPEQVLRDRHATAIENAQMIADSKQRNAVITELNRRNSLAKQALEDEYKTTKETAEEYVYRDGGSYKDVPASIWGRLKAKDQAALKKGPNVENDQDALYELATNPSLWEKDALAAYKSRLTPSTYAAYAAKGVAEISSSINTDLLKAEAQAAGLYKDSGMSSKQKALFVQVRAQIDKAFQAEANAQNRPLTRDQQERLIRGILKPVRVQVTESGLFSDGTEIVPIVNVPDPSKVVIPPDELQKLRADLAKRGLPNPTPRQLGELYILKTQEQ